MVIELNNIIGSALIGCAAGLLVDSGIRMIKGIGDIRAAKKNPDYCLYRIFTRDGKKYAFCGKVSDKTNDIHAVYETRLGNLIWLRHDDIISGVVNKPVSYTREEELAIA